ncbi:Rho GTPase activation protein [Lactarius pseudohatsudake]|nr:Rho GTPase activation protein [Lactarius pseudohatsudake]
MSFISVEPQSRVFLESHSNSLLTQFDIQLEIIADRYLAFFQERRRIEVSYISSLRKLHREATVVDAPFDPRAEPTTTRTAWDKVRDSLEGGTRLHILNRSLGQTAVAEANTQQAFVEILDNDQTGDRTRKRVEGSLEDSAAKYANHAENTILKLQQAYLKKHHPRQHSQDGPNKRSGNGDGRQEDLEGREPSKSEEGIADIIQRSAVALLNTFRLKRVENLEDGYDCLEGLVFTPTVTNVLVKYMDGLTTACTTHVKQAMSTSAEVETSLAGTDTSDLRASFGHALSYSIPPLTLYCNYRPNAYSNLIFGVPLVNLTTNRDYVPKVIRMCIEEVEKRGLDTHKIYSVGSIYDANVLQANDIYSVAMLLGLYLRDLPEPLFTPSLEDCRQYRKNRARYTENDCSVLRSKIQKLHPIHWASLEALLLHLFRVASHSDKNAMNVKTLAAQFCYSVFRGNTILEGGVHAKARYNDFVDLL